MNGPNPALPPVNPPSQIEVSANIGAPTPTKIGLMGSVKEYKVDITITDHATGKVTVLSIMDKSQEKVQKIASAMFEKLQEQANTSNTIDIKKIKKSIASDENLDPKVAADLKKMIGNFLKERSASVDVLNKYSHDKSTFPMWNKTNLEKAAFTHSPVELTEDDFDVRHFESEIAILKKSERFDPKNEKEIKAWARFAAKMRVAADDPNREKIDELLQNEDIQMILDKGIRLFKNFNYLRASNEVDPRLREMVEEFEDLRGRLPAELTNSIAAYQVKREKVDDLQRSLDSIGESYNKPHEKVMTLPVDSVEYDEAYNECQELIRRHEEIGASLVDAKKDLKRADLTRAEQKHAYTAEKYQQAFASYTAAEDELEEAEWVLVQPDMEHASDAIREEAVARRDAALEKEEAAGTRLEAVRQKKVEAEYLVGVKRSALEELPALPPEDEEEPPDGGGHVEVA